jgi:D-inositol-3-phosphate glycosyltransferase
VVEARQLVRFYDADPGKIVIVPPGVDLHTFSPRRQSRSAARRRLGLREDAVVLAFVGRIQPLKAPDVLLCAAAELLARDPTLRDRLVALITGGPSGTGMEHPGAAQELASALGIADITRFMPPQPRDELATVYRAADVLAVPSYSESFGLVALEAQACGTPVVAAAVGGLPVAVEHGITGLLVTGHRTADWADALAAVVLRPAYRDRLSRAAVEHASGFSWERTTDTLLATYAQAATALQDSLLGVGVAV